MPATKSSQKDVLAYQLVHMLNFLSGFAKVHYIVFQNKFITDEEATVVSARQSTSPHNIIENIGDNVATIDSREHVAAMLQHTFHENADELASSLCYSIMSNVGLGPFFAFAFQCDVVFTLAAGVNETRESRAGMFEALLGCIHRHGSRALLWHIIKYCTVINMLLIIYEDTLSMVHDVCGWWAPEAMRKCILMDSGQFTLSNRLDGLLAAEKERIFDMIQQWMETCIHDLAHGTQFPTCSLCQRQLMTKDDEYELKSATTKLVPLHTNPPQYMLKLVCHESTCNARAETQPRKDFHSCYEDANALGWGKPKSSKRWVHSRCPKCRDGWF